MKQETINKAVEVLDYYIDLYQRDLTSRLKLRLSAISTIHVDTLGNYDYGDIRKHEIILADLSLVKTALTSGKSKVKIRGSLECAWMLYNDTHKIIEEAGFCIDGDPDGTIYLCSLDEDE